MQIVSAYSPIATPRSCRIGILVGMLAFTFPITVNSQIGPNSEIPPVLLFPNVAIIPAPYIIYLEDEGNPGNPLVGATVTLEFSEEACDLLVLCDSPFDDCGQSFSTTTDANGEAAFTICGGGCWDETICPTGGYLVKVSVNGVEVAKVGVRSSDVIDLSALTACELWCTGEIGSPGTSSVLLGDVVYFTYPIKYKTSDPCADVDGSGFVDLGDAVRVTPALKFGAFCDEPVN